MDFQKFVLLIFIFLTSAANATKEPEPINWNDEKLNWHNYEEGMKKIQATGSPGLFIIYADWCTTCKAYSELFADEQVVNNLEGLVLIRENRDLNLKISQQYDYDGEYIPRTFALDNKGQVMQNFYSDSSKYTYFIPAGSVVYLSNFANMIKSQGQ